MTIWRDLEDEAEYFFGTARWVELATAHVNRAIAWNATYTEGHGAFVAALGVTRFAAGLLECRVFRDLHPIFQGPPLLDAVVDANIDGKLSLHEVMSQFGRWHVVALRGLRVKSPWLRLGGPDGIVEVEPDGGSGIFDTSAAFEQRWRSVSRRIQKTVRRLRARMDDRGKTVVAVGEAVGNAFDEFVKLEAAGWKGREGTCLAQRPAERIVLRDYLVSDATAEVHSLVVDGVLAASILTVACKSTRSALKTAYNEQMGEIAPGYLLLADLVESCCNDPKIDRVDFVVWQPYYDDWGMQREPTYKLTAFNSRTMYGRLARACWRNRGVRSSILAATRRLGVAASLHRHDVDIARTDPGRR